MAHFHKHRMDIQNKKKKKMPFSTSGHPWVAEIWVSFSFSCYWSFSCCSQEQPGHCLICLYDAPTASSTCSPSTVVSLQHGFQHRQSYMHTQVCIYRHAHICNLCFSVKKHKAGGHCSRLAAPNPTWHHTQKQQSHMDAKLHLP